MSDPLPPFWPGVFRRFGNIFCGTLSVFISLAVVGTGLTIFAAILALLSGDTEVDKYQFVSGDEASSDRLLQISVTGPILGSPLVEDNSLFGSLLGVTYGYQIQSQLEAAAKDARIKGVLIQFFTPGGTIFGSQAIADGIKSYQQKTGKPVYAFVEGLSASGGVWAMVAADKIYADYGSVIGSIGILGPTLQYYNKPTAINGGLLGGGVTTENGIEETTISAGRGKDAGNPFRRPTPEEVKTLQAGVEREYDNFVRHVARARKIQPAVIRDQMGAMIFDNHKAKEFGLIDGTLGRKAAIAQLAKAASLGEEFQLVRPKRKQVSIFGQLVGATQPSEALRQQRVNQDLCTLSQQRILAYYGNVQSLCPSR